MLKPYYPSYSEGGVEGAHHWLEGAEDLRVAGAKQAVAL